MRKFSRILGTEIPKRRKLPLKVTITELMYARALEKLRREWRKAA